jgi:hypothetical protein
MARGTDDTEGEWQTEIIRCQGPDPADGRDDDRDMGIALTMVVATLDGVRAGEALARLSHCHASIQEEVAWPGPRQQGLRSGS